MKNYEGNNEDDKILVIKGFWQRWLPPCILLQPNGFTFKAAPFEPDKGDNDDETRKPQSYACFKFFKASYH